MIRIIINIRVGLSPHPLSGLTTKKNVFKLKEGLTTNR